MKLSRGSLIVILIVLAILLVGVVQMIARGLGHGQSPASRTALLRAGQTISASPLSS